MTITPYEPPAPLPALELDEHARAWVTRLRAAAEIAAYIGGTEFVPDSLRNRPEAITAAILYGEALGLPPIVALSRITVIKGRPTLTAEAQRSLILAAGHELWFEESTVTRAIAAGRRRGEDRVSRITFTLDDAKRAGIAGQQNWRTYPAEMLRARASAALARVLFADVIAGLAAAEEIEDAPDNGPPIPPPTPPPPPPADNAEQAQPKTTRTRKRAPAREPVTPTPPPDPQPEPEVPTTEPLVTEAQRRRIFATMRDVGLHDRDEQHDYMAAVIGHPVETTNELTIGEASKLVDALEQLAERKTSQPEQTEETATDGEQTPLERLEELIAVARDQRALTSRDLYTQIAAFRRKQLDDLILEVGGRDNAGHLQWAPLRDTLQAHEIVDLAVFVTAHTPDDDIKF